MGTPASNTIEQRLTQEAAGFRRTKTRRGHCYATTCVLSGKGRLRPGTGGIFELTQCTQLTSFNVGYIAQDIVLAVKIGLAGTLLTFLVVVPPWPFFNKNPVKWLPYHSPLGTTTTTTT